MRQPDLDWTDEPCVCGHDEIDHSRLMKQCDKCAECHEFRCRKCAVDGIYAGLCGPSTAEELAR